jgi:hypothetical protein
MADEKEPKETLAEAAHRHSAAVAASPEFNEPRMQNDEKSEIEQLVRDYAAGKISWQLLQERGIENYLDLLGMLGDLGLRPPRAPLESDAEARANLGQFLSKFPGGVELERNPSPSRDVDFGLHIQERDYNEQEINRIIETGSGAEWLELAEAARENHSLMDRLKNCLYGPPPDIELHDRYEAMAGLVQAIEEPMPEFIEKKRLELAADILKVLGGARSDHELVERDCAYTAESIEVLKGLERLRRRDDRHVVPDDTEGASCPESERDRHAQDD